MNLLLVGSPWISPHCPQWRNAWNVRLLSRPSSPAQTAEREVPTEHQLFGAGTSVRTGTFWSLSKQHSVNNSCTYTPLVEFCGMLLVSWRRLSIVLNELVIVKKLLITKNCCRFRFYRDVRRKGTPNTWLRTWVESIMQTIFLLSIYTPFYSILLRDILFLY